MKDYTKLSKFLALILRHKPEAIKLKLDNGGWANIIDIIRLSEQHNIDISKEDIFEIVKRDEKSRYMLSNNSERIRACQGYSIAVDLEFIPKKPPNVLYHGTAIKNLNSIKISGINSGNRNYVHLSVDKVTAMNVGARHGKPIVLIINTIDMFNDGLEFFLSDNNVWLTKYIPKHYIQEPF